MAAAACAFVASKSSSDELHGAYRDSAQTLLDVSARSFEDGVTPADLDSPEELEDELQRVMNVHQELNSLSVYRAGDSSPAASVGEHGGGETEFGLVTEALALRADGLR